MSNFLANAQFWRRKPQYEGIEDFEDDEIPIQTGPTTLQFLSKLNPFRSNPIQLPESNQQIPQLNQDSDPIEFSKWDRLIIFAVSMAGALSCWIVCFLLLPVLSLKPRKFAILWSLGSILFIFSFGALQGLRAYLIHLFSTERLWFTMVFTGSIIITLISSLILHSTVLAIISCMVQLIASVAYTISYFPFGRNGIRLASNVAIVQVDNWVNS